MTEKYLYKMLDETSHRHIYVNEEDYDRWQATKKKKSREAFLDPKNGYLDIPKDHEEYHPDNAYVIPSYVGGWVATEADFDKDQAEQKNKNKYTIEDVQYELFARKQASINRKIRQWQFENRLPFYKDKFFDEDFVHIQTPHYLLSAAPGYWCFDLEDGWRHIDKKENLPDWIHKGRGDKSDGR